MDAEAVDAVLIACESALGSSTRPDLRALGFWRAVAAVKRHPEWADRFADRIAQVDRRAFLGRVALVLPLPVGVALLVVGSAVGVLCLGAAFTLEPTLAGIAVLIGTAALIGTTHDLAHLVVGRALGIRFTHWFADLPRRPQPGLKIDYASYLRTPARSRAWMHASGAIISKIVPFKGVVIALAAQAPWWAPAILIAIGMVQLVTDALFSVRVGDWKKFRRELRYA